MELTTRSANTVAILAISGRFDSYETELVREWLTRAAETPPAHLVVNLTGVQFTDSAALATLVQGMKRCRQQGGDLHLCGLQQPVRIIFELTRLDKAFRIFANEDDAISAFHS